MATMFATQSLVEYGTAEGARLIRTGQVQQGGGEDAFVDAVCDAVAITPGRNFIDCDDVQYQVVALNDFAEAVSFPDPTFDQNGDLEDQGFDPGGVSDVVLVRVAYRYDVVTPLMGPLLTNSGDNTRSMVSTLVIETEPYEFE